MSTSNLSRLIYRLVLSLHPSQFRDRFSDEMLWVFDEQIREVNSSTLLTDALLSLIRQHWKAGNYSEARPAPFELQVATINIGAFQWLQATVGALTFVLAFSLAVAQGSPPLQKHPLPMTERRFIPFVCSQFQPKMDASATTAEFSHPSKTVLYRTKK
jgi:hypothetical protein